MFLRDYGDLSILLIYIYFQLIFLHSGDLRSMFQYSIFSSCFKRMLSEYIKFTQVCVYGIVSSCTAFQAMTSLVGK